LMSVEFKPDRSRSTWQKLPGLITRPWTAQSRKQITLPANAAGVSFEGDGPITLDMPAVSYRRTVSHQANTLTEDVLSRESGVEVAASEISTTRKIIEDAFAKPLRIRLPASYPQRWADVAAQRQSPAVTRMIELMEQRIAEKPDDAERLANRAWLSTRMLDWADAEAGYSKAVAVDPSAARYRDRAYIRSQRGDRAGALKDAQAAYDLEPGDKETRSRLAGELAQNGKLDEALDLLEANPDISSDDGANVLLERADLMLHGGRGADAISLVDSAITKRPNVATFRNSRCWIKGLTNADLTGALADCNRAIELAADPAGYYDSRALVHFRSGRLKEALADYDAALAINPEIAASLFMRGIAAKRGGNTAQSSADIGAARRLYPAIDSFFTKFGIKP
jgi:tetratricopeptide (TPR) repeat protein